MKFNLYHFAGDTATAPNISKLVELIILVEFGEGSEVIRIKAIVKNCEIMRDVK